ncbi:hypothetical protein QMZ25_10715 [Stenotrophomonas sp. RS-48]|uniref:hypothetical protein n=1 Tax=Stenotrophomonas sp. RS-48 TaxID=3043300 RepID=UPI0024B5794C|nr:hypothetical protein [Stenotrophomonas sp. RS-48]MDI9249060.1 hypothetical protein [Stenotrophomonas sp. RS-48]
MQKTFNGIQQAACIALGVAIGIMAIAPWPNALSIESTLTITAAIIAALGTWAVGIGAMHYANEAHKLRLREIESAKTSGFVSARAVLIDCQMTIGIYERMLAEAKGRDITTRGLHTCLRAIMSMLPRTPVSSMLVFEDVERMLAHPIDITSAMIRISADQFIEEYPPHTDSQESALQEHFQHVISQTRTLAKLAHDLAEKLDSRFVKREH